MREVFIQYNPYKVTTEVLIDGEAVKQNSKLRIPEGKRLQEWVDELPKRLMEECATKQFKLTFYGTSFDYDDIVSAAIDAKENNIHIETYHKPAKEIAYKERQIAEVFEKIKKGPLDSLREKSVINAFEKAFNSEFEVNIIATMSSGKSTLVNALLGQSLMPSRNRACTATITRIKDTDTDTFSARVYDKKYNVIEDIPNLTSEHIKHFNNDTSVGVIEVEGNIPFVNADDMSLVLIDTPGTNNAQDRSHKETTYTLLDESSKTLILFVLDADKFGTEDDKQLLSDIAKSMKTGGKQSRDRFIFVINRVDTLKDSKDPLDEFIEDAQRFIEELGIKNPAIYPISALTALSVRMLQTESVDEEELGTTNELINKYTKYNKDDRYSCYIRTPLSNSVKKKLEKELEKCRIENNIHQEVLIHCGMTPLEEAIRLYVLKYAKTAKIKNVVDSFRGKLESQQAMDKLVKEIQENKSEREEIKKQLDAVKEQVNDVRKANDFKEIITDLNATTMTDVIEKAKSIQKENQELISNLIEMGKSAGRVEKREAKKLAKMVKNSVEDIQIKVKVELDNLISNKFKGELEYIFLEYQNRLRGFVEGIGDYKIDLNITNIMKGQLEVDFNEVLNESTEVVYEVVEERWVDNTSKKWYKPWTWFDDDGYYEDVYDDVEYVDLEEFVYKYLTPFEESLFTNVHDSIDYAKAESEKLIVNCMNKFEELDKMLEAKLEDLKSYTEDDESLSVKIQEAEERLRWIEGIIQEVDAILEI